VAAVLLVATAISVGVLTFATAMTDTLRYSVETKARIFVGSDAQVTLQAPLRATPGALRGSTTTVVSTDVDVPGIGHVDVLGVDPSTLPDAAAWDDRLGGPLGSLVARLASGNGSGVEPALAVGAIPDRLTLPFVAFGGAPAPLPIRVVGRPSAFPQEQSSTLVVLDTRALPAAVRQLAAVELWVKGWGTEAQNALREAGAKIRFVTTVADVSRTPDLAAVGWTYGFFESLGALTGVIAVGGLLLYLATRQRSRALAYGLTRRMGMRRAVHALSILLEVGAGLLAGYVVGTALATAGVALVYGHLDPEGDLPPAPLLHLPVDVYLALLGAAVAVAALATGLTQRAADRTRTADLLRLGTT
jgi:hypothetical protein